MDRRKNNPTRSGGRNRRTVRRKGRLAVRRNRRLGPRVNRRNRLQRAQAAVRNKRGTRGGRFRRFNNFRRRNLRLRKVFVGGLPNYVDNRRLYGLFRPDGVIIGCRVIYNRLGISRGFGELEFANPRAAWRVIKRWNNTTYQGKTLRVEYKRRRRRVIRNNNFGNFRRNNAGSYNRGYRTSNNFRPRGSRGSYGGGFRRRY